MINNEYIVWRALGHVRRDALLYAHDEPIRLELLLGFVEDAIGYPSGKSNVDTTRELVADLIKEGFLRVPGEQSVEAVLQAVGAKSDAPEIELAITERGRVWVDDYYHHLEVVAGQKPAV